MSGNNASSSEFIIRTENIVKNYQLGEVLVEALRGISFNVKEGEFLVVLGPSGSGKSTLLNILGGMETPTSGKFYFENTDVSGYSPRELTIYRRKQIGFIFQFYNLVPNLTARENVQLSAQLSENPEDVEMLLYAMEMVDRADHFPAQMSGGEQQRVAIARALAKNPKVLLCDEPTGALDYETGKLILGQLERVNKQMGKTLLVITHNAAIGLIADRIVKLRSGNIHEIIENKEKKHFTEIQW